VDDEPDEMVVVEYGTHEAALRALAHDFILLLTDASTSLGFLRGKFSDGARRSCIEDDP